MTRLSWLFSASHRRAACIQAALAAVVWLAAVGCSSASDHGGGTAPTGSSPASTATPTPAPTGAATTPTAPPTGSTTPPGPTVTTVRVHYASSSAPPDAALSLRGSVAPLSWDTSVPLVTTSPGLFTWSASDLATALELKPMLGATWSRGPNYHLAPGQTLDLYPHFMVTHGTVDKRYPSFVSAKLPSTRGVWVYLPPTYVENTASRFGVLYMHDGSNLFDPALAFGGHEWMVDETLDAAAEDGTIRETIVVGIESTADRIDELTPTVDASEGAGGKADQYLSMMIDEIKPMVDKDLRTIPLREQTGIMGSSLGGLASAYGGVTRADVFGLVGAMSPSTWWDGTVILGDVSTTPTRTAKPIRVYVDSGDSGTSNDDVVNTTALAARYRTVGYSDGKDLLHVVQAGGQHNEIYWAERLPAALHFLLGARPD